MSRKPYDLAEVIKRERHEVEPIVITFGDDSVSIDPPILWPDEISELAYIPAAIVLLGDKYEAFCAAGGTASLLFERIIPDAVGAGSGESTASTGS